MPPTTSLPPGAAQAAHAIASGQATPGALLAEVQDRIRLQESRLHAFAFLPGAEALDQQAARASRLSGGRLRGVPVAVKDVFDTADMPTAYGSAIWTGHRPRADAAAVALLRAAGAVLVGKTVTTEFASYTPGPTANPHDPARTPGGSSSGSAAAVASGMAAAALGTQTAGSMIRPAAYCGVVGFKPSFGMIPRAGLKPLAESFDTVGSFGRCVEDAALLAEVAAGLDAHLLPPDSAAPGFTIGLLRSDWEDEAEPAQRQALEDAAARLRRAGIPVRELPPPGIGWLNDRQGQAIAWETARAFAWEGMAHPELLSAKFREICARGMAMTAAEHRLVWLDIARARQAVSAMFEACDLVLTHSAPGEAPRGLDATGAPTFNRLWSVAGGPCLSLPFGHGPNLMPLGVQLAAARGQDGLLLAAARRAEAILAAG